MNLRRPFEPESAQWSFRIAASDYVVFLLLGTLLRSLTERAPNISVRFLALEPSAGERLAAGELDFAVLPEELEPSLPSVPLFEDSWVCAVWSGHRTRARSVHARRVSRAPALELPPRRSGSWLHRRELSRRQLGFERKIVASTESFATAPFLLRETPFVTLVPRRLGERLQTGCRNPARRAAARHAAAAREADLEPALHGERRRTRGFARGSSRSRRRSERSAPGARAAQVSAPADTRYSADSISQRGAARRTIATISSGSEAS